MLTPSLSLPFPPEPALPPPPQTLDGVEYSGVQYRFFMLYFKSIVADLALRVINVKTRIGALFGQFGF